MKVKERTQVGEEVSSGEKPSHCLLGFLDGGKIKRYKTKDRKSKHFENLKCKLNDQGRPSEYQYGKRKGSPTGGCSSKLRMPPRD